MGGINSLLSMEYLHSIPLVSKTPTIIFGMDVSHGSPGRADVPSFSAVCFVLDSYDLNNNLIICLIVPLFSGMCRW